MGNLNPIGVIVHDVAVIDSLIILFAIPPPLVAAGELGC